MEKDMTRPVVSYVLDEQQQRHETRRQILADLEKALGRPVVTLFTTFQFPVMLDNSEADMLEGILQKTDLSNGLAVVLSSPGGDGLAAERIIQVCRKYSATGEYWVIVPSKAKSAATIICFGASKIIMGGTSELGPVDPQIFIQGTGLERFSIFNIVKSYDGLFKRAVNETSGNLQPYLQQLEHYDEREIEEFRAALALSEDIAVRSLQSGMLSKKSSKQIKTDLNIFLTPEKTKTHGRPIYLDEAKKAGLNIEEADVKSHIWSLVYELYIRTDNFVSTKALKCIETKDNAFFVSASELSKRGS
jgi:ClpP class serine protease